MKHVLLLLILLPISVNAQTPQSTAHSPAYWANVRASISTGLYGLKRAQVDSILQGKFEASDTIDVAAPQPTTHIAYAPFSFHGMPGVLQITFDMSDRAAMVQWTHSEPVSAFNQVHSMIVRNPNSRFAQIASAFRNDVTKDQYNAFREKLGLPRLDQPSGSRMIAIWPVAQHLSFNIGALEYSEFPGIHMHKGDALTGAEPTFEIK